MYWQHIINENSNWISLILLDIERAYTSTDTKPWKLYCKDLLQNCSLVDVKQNQLNMYCHNVRFCQTHLY